jgi:hypothetical protein
MKTILRVTLVLVAIAAMGAPVIDTPIPCIPGIDCFCPSSGCPKPPIRASGK